MAETIDESPQAFILDIGGEGRHAGAWNLNPRMVRSFGPDRGRPIPRLIRGRCDAIPLADGCVDLLIVERTPLRRASLREIQRVAKPGATVLLRHAIGPLGDPHRLALAMLAGETSRQMTTIGRHHVQETIVRLRGGSDYLAAG